MKVPKEIKGRKQSSDFGDLSIATSSAAAQNHPNNWARHVRSPLGNVSCLSPSMILVLSYVDLTSVSVDELSCSER